MMLFHLFFLMHRHQRKPEKALVERIARAEILNINCIIASNINDATNYCFVMPACKCNQHRTFCISSKVLNTLLKNTYTARKVFVFSCKGKHWWLTITSCAALPSSPKLETEPSANQVSSPSCMESQFIWTYATSARHAASSRSQL